MASTLLEVGELDKPLDAQGKTKLLQACEESDVNRASSLISSKASPDVANKEGQTPLYVACRVGCGALAQVLLHARADISKPLHASGYTPLYIASQKGNLECCTMLINCRADVNKSAKNRSTPLLCAHTPSTLRQRTRAPPRASLFFCRGQSVSRCCALLVCVLIL